MFEAPSCCHLQSLRPSTTLTSAAVSLLLCPQTKLAAYFLKSLLNIPGTLKYNSPLLLQYSKFFHLNLLSHPFETLTSSILDM
jgi:hypothetical protein